MPGSGLMLPNGLLVPSCGRDNGRKERRRDRDRDRWRPRDGDRGTEAEPRVAAVWEGELG